MKHKISHPSLSTKRILKHMSCGALAGLFALSAHTALAQTNYDFIGVDGVWSDASNWDPNGVPNDINNTKSYINSGQSVTVDGNYSTGFVFVGGSGVLTVSGAGNSLSIGNAGGNNPTGFSIAGHGGQVIVENGATLNVTGETYLGGDVTPGAPSHPRITVTNATANFGTLAFYGPDTNVQGELVLNEGADVHINFTGSSNSKQTTLIFNGGASGFGQATGDVDAARIYGLAINPGSWTGEGTFTLIDDALDATFTTITFNGSAYVLGDDVTYGGYNWNVTQTGTTDGDLILNVSVIPEARSLASLLGLTALLTIVARRRKNQA